MSTGSTNNYNLPYPLSTDPVNVASDIQDLADSLDTFLLAPSFINNIDVDGGSITTPALTANVFNTNATTINIGGAATDINIGSGSGQVDFAGDVNVATGKGYEVNNVSVLNATTLGSSVVNSSLTSLGTITSGTWSANTIAVDKGGTGLTSYVVGDIVYASGTAALSRLAAVATGNALISGGVGSAPSWGKIDLTSHISGTLPVANGGTGVTSSTGTGNVVLSVSPTLTGTPVAPTALADTSTTQIATTEFVTSQASNIAPLMDGTVAIGSSLRYARQDHIHPTDTSRASAASPTFTGTISSEGSQIIMESAVTGSPTDDVSFTVNRGTSPDVEIRWNETGDSWQFTNDGTTYYDIPTGSGSGGGTESALMLGGM